MTGPTAEELVQELPNLHKHLNELTLTEDALERLGRRKRELSRLVGELRAVTEVLNNVPVRVTRLTNGTTAEPLGSDLEYTRRADVRGAENGQWLLFLDVGMRSNRWKSYATRSEAEDAAKRYAALNEVPGPPED